MPWDSANGNPYDYTTIAFRDIESVEASWEIGHTPFPYGRVREKLYFGGLLKLVDTLPLSHISLLACTRRGILLDSLAYTVLDVRQPILVRLTYPFRRPVTLTISPLVRLYELDPPTSTILPEPGYLIWQIARCYGTIYHDHNVAAGVHSHPLEHLRLDYLHLHADNRVTIDVSI